MSSASITRTIPHKPEAVMDLMLDFQRYPSFVPGVTRIKLKPLKETTRSKSSVEELEVEAFLKNSKFSGTVRVSVEADRSAGTIRVKHRFGPFKILSASFHALRVESNVTEVRCKVELMSSLLALNSIIGQHLMAAIKAYAEVFVRELARLSTTNPLP